MSHQSESTKLSAAPESDDISLVTDYFNHKCNCYSYAVQDYLAGQLSDQSNDDFSYLPRPGQTRGHSYLDLKGRNVEGMRRAVHEDGIDFAGQTYPKKIPAGYYVICCFLEPNEYHFIRQNRDGSWSSKNGLGIPSRCDNFGGPLKNPEDFYRGDKAYQFVGYFFVPEGGIRTGVRGYETRHLEELKKRAKLPIEKQEKRILSELVALSDEGDRIVKAMQRLSQKSGINAVLEAKGLYESYSYRLAQMSRLCRIAGYVRKNVLKNTYTRPKNAKKGRDSSR